MRKFHIGDVLSITTGKLVSPRLMDGVYDILNYMTNDNLMTHQLPRASRQCRPYLLDRHPTLAGINVPELTKESWKPWLAEMVTIHGEELEVEPIPLDDRTPRDPIEELAEMVPAEKIIVAKLDP